MQPTPVFLPGKSHGQRSLAGYRATEESDTTARLNSNEKRTHSLKRRNYAGVHRYPGMRSQVGLRKHQNSSWAISNPKRWCRESAALNMPANLENSSGHRTGKRSVFIPIPKKGNAKNVQTTTQLYSFSHASKAMLKFSKPGFNSTWTMNFQMFKLDFQAGKGIETRNQIATIRSII